MTKSSLEVKMLRHCVSLRFTSCCFVLLGYWNFGFAKTVYRDLNGSIFNIEHLTEYQKQRINEWISWTPTEEQRKTIYLTDEEDTFLVEGYPIDFSHNETRGDFDAPLKLISVPGCPNSVRVDFLERHPYHNYPFVYYGSPPKCFRVGLQGPCPEGMSLGVQPHSPYGICLCDCYFSINFSKRDFYTYDNPWDPFLHVKQPFCVDTEAQSVSVYLSPHKKCFQLRQKGPCKDHEWLVMDGPNYAVCRPRRCPADQTEEKVTEYGYSEYNTVRYFFDKNSNQCQIIGGNCSSSLGNFTYGEFEMFANETSPSCREISGYHYGGAASATVPLSCRVHLGEYFSSILKRCVKVGKAFRKSSSVG